MSTKPKPKADASATYKQLPKETKEMMKLKDEEEKTIGPEKVEVTRKIEDKSDEANQD